MKGALSRAEPVPPNWTGKAVAVGLFLLVATFYLPALRNGFLYDDPLLILKPTPLRSLADLLALFGQPYYQGLPYYRPLTSASFLVQRSLQGSVPLPFHLVNVMLGGVATVGAYYLLRRPCFALAKGVALAAAIVFGLHPVVSSCVYPISGRDTLLAMIFMEGSVACWLRGDRAGRVTSVALYAAGLFSKEAAVVTPAIILLAEVLDLSGSGRSLRASLLRVAPFAAVLALYLGVRHLVLTGGDLSLGDPVNVPLAYLYALQTALVPFRALLYEPPAAAWLSLPRLAVVSGLVAAAVVVAHKKWPEVRKPLLFWLGWSVLAQLPAANWFLQETLFDERYVALCLLGLVGIAAVVISAHASTPRSRITAVGAMSLVALGCAIVAFGRGPYFEEVAFYREWLRIKPTSFTARYNLGNALSQRGQLAEAIAEYDKALQLNDGSAQAHNNLGETYVKAGAVDDAIRHFHEAVRLDENNSKAWNNLGSAVALEGDVGGAIPHFRAALRIDPAYTNALFNLGFALLNTHQDAEAEKCLREVLRREPEYVKARTPLALALLHQGRWKDAEIQVREALRAAPDDVVARRLLSEIERRS